MKRKVTFREYLKPEVLDDGTSERGEFLGSFNRTIEGVSLIEISDKAESLAEELSKESDSDVRVFDIL